jgi:hypothetical protein
LPQSINLNLPIIYLLQPRLSRNRTAGASIGGPCALAYTSRTAYVSYMRVYHLLIPSTLIINRVTSCRLLKYIYLAATIPHLMTLHCAFFLLLTPSLWLILCLYNTAGTARSSVFISNLLTSHYVKPKEQPNILTQATTPINSRRI